MSHLRPVPRKPHFFAIAGAPAAGKTSFIKRAIVQGFLPKEAYHHDCDAVMLGEEGYRRDVERLGPEESFKKWEGYARNRAEEDLKKALHERKTIIYDRSCGLEDSLRFLDSVVHESGYQLSLSLLWAHLPVLLERAKEREAESGRHVPPRVIAERAIRISQSWLSFLKLSDQVSLFDTELDPIIDFHHPVAHWNGQELLILNDVSYYGFVSQGKLRLKPSLGAGPSDE